MPVTGSIMPPFTVALYGHDALVRLLRGFVVGLSGFTAFFATLAFTLATWGVAAAFLSALALALAAVFTVDRLAHGPRRP